MNKSLDAQFMASALMSSDHGTCLRRKVACVITRRDEFLVIGFNTTANGEPTCEDRMACLMVDGHCVRGFHAEIGAIACAARYGTNLMESTAYVTARPCWTCLKALLVAGVNRIVYDQEYEDPMVDAWIQINADFPLERYGD